MFNFRAPQNPPNPKLADGFRDPPAQAHPVAQIEEPKMASDLDKSLTAMDWLPRLSVGGAIGNATKNGKNDPSGAMGLGHTAMRKAPNSPLDTNATLDSNEVPAKDGKPPYSYANLITFAINSTHRKKMTLSEIYQWICDNFPYYKDAGNGWKVSIFDASSNSLLQLGHTPCTQSDS